MFSEKLSTELERRGYKTVRQKADACGLSYEHMRQVLKGKPLAEERIFEIGAKLKLSEEIIASLVANKVLEQAKEPATREILSKLLSSKHFQRPSEDFSKLPPAHPALQPDTNLANDEKKLVKLYRQLDLEDKAEIRGEIRGMLKADKYQGKPGVDLQAS